MSEKTNPFLKPGKQFLVNFLSGVGAKPGKFSVAGINLPEFGVTENTVDKLFPNREAYNKEVIAKNKELNKKGSIYGSNFPIVEKTASAISGAPQIPSKIVDAGKKIFNETGKVEKPELGESYSRKQFLDDFRNMQVTDSLLRRGELAAERRESINFMRSMYPLLEQAGRNQLERAIEGDQRSPTKISQQILRAKQGEAALMNAIANQTTSAAQVGNIGTSRRYGRG